VRRRIVPSFLPAGCPALCGFCDYPLKNLHDIAVVNGGAFLALTERVIVTIDNGVATVEAVPEPENPEDNYWIRHG